MNYVERRALLCTAVLFTPYLSICARILTRRICATKQSFKIFDVPGGKCTLRYVNSKNSVQIIAPEVDMNVLTIAESELTMAVADDAVHCGDISCDILDVPSEVLTKVLSYLPVEDVLSARLACRLLYDASCAPEIADQFTVELINELPCMWRTVIVNLRISSPLDFNDICIRDFLQNCRLRRLTICNNHISNNVFSFLLDFAWTLEDIQFEKCHFSLCHPSHDKVFASLKRLAFIRCPLDDMSMYTFVQLAPRIEKLIIRRSNLNYGRIIHDRFYPTPETAPSSDLFSIYHFLKTLRAYRKTLKHLDVVHMHDLQKVQCRCNNIIILLQLEELRLKSLHFNCCDMDSEQVAQAWTTIGHHAYSLQSLQLIGANIKTLPITKINVTTLQLTDCSITREAFSSIVAMDNLMDLSFINSKLLLDGYCFEPADVPLVNVEKLTIRRTHISPESVCTQLIKLFPKVRQLDISESSIRIEQFRVMTVAWFELKLLIMRLTAFSEQDLYGTEQHITPFAALKCLEVLDISNNDFTDRLCDVLRFPYLKKIYLFNNLSDMGMRALSLSCPNLEYIYSDRYNFCSVEELRILLPAFKKLKNVPGPLDVYSVHT